MSVRCILFLSFCCALFSPGIAEAGDPFLSSLPRVVNEAAREHLSAGNAYYRSADIEKALAEYQAGLGLEDAAIFLYNIGQCYRKLERYEDAIWVYKLLLNRRLAPKLEVRVRGFIDDLEAAIKARKPREPLDAASSEAPPADGPSRQPPAPAAPAPTLVQVPHTPTPLAESRWYRDGWAWGLTAAGVVGLAVAGWQLNESSDLNTRADNTPGQRGRQDLYDSASTHRNIGIAVASVATGTLVLGVVKLILHPAEHPEIRSTSWRMAPVRNGVSLLRAF